MASTHSQIIWFQLAQVVILIEKPANNGFVATALGWPDCVGMGETKDEAVSKVRAAVAERLAHGEIVQVQIEAAGTAVVNDPWVRMLGSCADDPTWDDYQAELRRIRAEANRVPYSDSVPEAEPMPTYVAAREVAALLRKINAGAVEIIHTDPQQLWKDAFAGDIEFIADGYRLTFFNDCAELDCVTRVVAPDGRVGTYDDWFAQGEKLFDLLRKWEIALLEEKLEEAR